MIILNKSAKREYHILKEYEAGIVLVGSEVKVIREGRVNIRGAYIKVGKEALFIEGMHISEYVYERNPLEPMRKRKLLLHKREKEVIQKSLETKGVSCIPLSVYFKKNYVKVKIAIGKGKKLYDKRQDIKKKDQSRQVERDFKGL